MAAIPRAFTIIGASNPAGGTIYGLNGQTIIGNSSGAWAITTNGTNQSITLTPGGTGVVLVTCDITNQTGLRIQRNGSQYMDINEYDGGLHRFNAIGDKPMRFDNACTSVADAYEWGVAGALKVIIARATGNLLLGGLGTDGTGFLQFPTGTTAAGGVTFGNVNLFQSASQQLKCGGASGANVFIIADNSGNDMRMTFSTVASFTTGSASMTMGCTNAGIFYLQSGSSGSALTLDASQQVTRGGTASGAVTTVTEWQKAVTAIANAVATTVLTITVPNAAHSAMVRVTVVGSLGAGGAIGANEASATSTYDIAVCRTAGVNTVGVISATYGSAATLVAGASTITVTAALAAVVGAVGATNTIPVQVTITRGSGASTNHTCLVSAEVANANTAGVTVA